MATRVGTWPAKSAFAACPQSRVRRTVELTMWGTLGACLAFADACSELYCIYCRASMPRCLDSGGRLMPLAQMLPDLSTVMPVRQKIANGERGMEHELTASCSRCSPLIRVSFTCNTVPKAFSHDPDHVLAARHALHASLPDFATLSTRCCTRVQWPGRNRAGIAQDFF